MTIFFQKAFHCCLLAAKIRYKVFAKTFQCCSRSKNQITKFVQLQHVKLLLSPETISVKPLAILKGHE